METNDYHSTNEEGGGYMVYVHAYVVLYQLVYVWRVSCVFLELIGFFFLFCIIIHSSFFLIFVTPQLIQYSLLWHCQVAPLLVKFDWVDYPIPMWIWHFFSKMYINWYIILQKFFKKIRDEIYLFNFFFPLSY